MSAASYDVAIVGGGPVGLSAAIELRARGVAKVALFELAAEVHESKLGAPASAVEVYRNLLVVEPRTIRGAERTMYGFETLTLAPIDRRLILARLLTRDERRWLDAYHARVREEIGPLVEGAVRAWLEQATAPL